MQGRLAGLAWARPPLCCGACWTRGVFAFHGRGVEVALVSAGVLGMVTVSRLS